mmetsp:Transcript_50584/g.158033  ORF Transcript_50584/g.158033 Transcript_50584/m.158033 type:complete len:630 (-) Transcript_50584:87-1976(-)
MRIMPLAREIGRRIPCLPVVRSDILKSSRSNIILSHRWSGYAQHRLWDHIHPASLQSRLPSCNLNSSRRAEDQEHEWWRKISFSSMHWPSKMTWVGIAAGGGAIFTFTWNNLSDPQTRLAYCESWNLGGKLKKNGTYDKKDEGPLAEDHRNINDYYEVLEVLGSGVHAVVKKARNKQTKELVAVKCVDKANMRRRQLAREIEILTTVSHPNVISLKDVFEDEKSVYLVLELVQGGELFDRIVNDGAFSEKDAAKMIRKITDALMHLHERKICHRDLKPENLLLTSKGSEADIKIADFGLSKILGEKTMMKRSCGTWAYWAPEILRRQPYDYSVDLWSMGVILYIMLSGVHPFDPDGRSTDAQIVERILRADYKFDPEYWAHVSPQAKDVIRHLIHMDPMQRYTCEQLLQHPWVAGNGVSDSPMPSQSLDALRGFNRQRKQFGQGLVGIVASQHYLRKVNRTQLLESEIQDMRAVFTQFSADSKEELEECERETEGHCSLPVMKLGETMRALGENVSDREAMRMALSSNCIDNHGRVPFSSFVALMAHYVEGRETEEDLRAAFAYLDTGKKGAVSVLDIQRALALVGVRMTEGQVLELVREVDTNNSGKISFEQFQQLFRSVGGSSVRTE